LYALKVCSISTLRKIKFCEFDDAGSIVRFSAIEKFHNEAQILQSLTHKNIVSFFEVTEHCYNLVVQFSFLQIIFLCS
jgi:serine/threonine protein kinase